MTQAEYERDLDALSERIAHEGHAAVSAFQKRLAGRLVPFVRDLREAREMPMTLELGEAVRNQLTQVFAILNRDFGVTI